MANPTRLSPLQGKVNTVKYNFFKHLHSTIKSEDTEVLGGLRARPNEIKARSSRPTWKNCSYTTQYCSIKTVLLIFPLPPDQHHCSDEAFSKRTEQESLSLHFESAVVARVSRKFVVFRLLEWLQHLSIRDRMWFVVCFNAADRIDRIELARSWHLSTCRLLLLLLLLLRSYIIMRYASSPGPRNIFLIFFSQKFCTLLPLNCLLLAEQINAIIAWPGSSSGNPREICQVRSHTSSFGSPLSWLLFDSVWYVNLLLITVACLFALIEPIYGQPVCVCVHF